MKLSLKTIIKRSPFEVATLAGMMLFVVLWSIPLIAEATAKVIMPSRATQLEIQAMQNATKPFGALPVAGFGNPLRTIRVAATAYNSEVAQTDDTPFITASGTHVRHGVIAANFLRIGTKVKIPDYFGDQIFIVEDRMNARYTNRIDIWMADRSDAIEFGVRTVAIEIYSK